jgi:hypothetical protein
MNNKRKRKKKGILKINQTIEMNKQNAYRKPLEI